ncbi:MAG: RND family transporter [Candidatus Abyssubacteria bacterium]|nr:RND family transporter [Candidatus Abyssubacteria bacterium]
MQRSRLLSSLINRYPLVVLTFSAVLTIILAAGIPKLTMRPFFEGDLPPSDPILRANEEYSAYFGKNEYAYLAVVGDTIYRASTLEKVVAITEELNSLDHVLDKETLSLATVRKVKWRDWGMDVRKYLSPVPQSPEEIECLRSDIRLDPDIYGKLVSTDETATLLAVKLSPGYDQRRLYNSLHAIADSYSGPERIYPFGRQVMSEEASLGIARDARILGPAALLLMALGMFAFFRSLRLTLGLVLMIGISIVWTMGLMYYLGFSLSMLSPSIPAVLIALGSSYMIHVIYSCSELAAKTGTADGIIEGVSKMSRPIGLAAVTSMVGFATLTVFKILSIREFGICVAVGVGFAALLSLIVLPSIVVLQKGVLPSDPGGRFRLLDRLLEGFTRVGLKHKYIVLAGGALLLVVSVIGVSKVKVGFAPEEIFPRDHRARKVVALFVDKFHGPYSLNAMFTAKEPDGLKSPEALRQIDSFQQFAEGLPKVNYATSIVDIIKKMNRILNEDSAEFYKVPDSKAMVAQSLLLHSLTRDPAQFENLMDYDVMRCKTVITTTAIDSAELEDIYRRLVKYCEENLKGDLTVEFGGQSMVWMAQNHYIITGKIMNIAANTVLIWIICAIAFRSVRLGLISILPLSMATLATFGLMGHLGIRLDTATAVLTGISVGVGVDFAIHFISRLKRELQHTTLIDEAIGATMLGSGRAIIFDAISNILGFMAFMFSGFAPVRILGMLICFTMISCVVLTLLLVPAILALVPVPFRQAGRQTIFLRAQPEE